MLEAPDATVVVLLCVAALLAGWVDAVVGGGGLVQLPALLVLLPGAAPAQVLATNKLASVAGTATATVTYYRRVRPDLRTALPMAGAAVLGAAGGAACAALLPQEAFRPIVLVLLVLVAAYTLARPALGEAQALRFHGRRHHVVAVLSAVVIGFYDGIFGPGTGSFLVFALVGLLGYSFLQASAKARIANLATNLGALAVFVPQGAVLWGVGALMALCNLTGGFLGARTAIARGSRFVRVVFLVVVAALVARLGYDMLTGA
ncbi:TSUP family transporter [Vallicoccus soli]|uniref:Probable membrane transporter protein n=1 Tax=Vallicoccus soli TaxID=2339232 RepID=A0A3A3Z372_9ACTN|nr:TSUP family transporter [Vallicoccus soli]RJK94911.1 sulfite exporter TauE/SafE family protein [Vallicoccus soli]